jgi:prepilin-type N-terminal cleavage/methylation domain-containing protein
MEKELKKSTSRKRSFANSGYTFIEVLVGLTIITLIFAFGYVGFRDFARRQTITSAVRSLTGELRLAQQQALAGNKPDNVNCNPPNTLEGYYFRVTSTTTYQIEALCSGGVVEVKQNEITDILSISTPSPNPILFKVLGNGTNIPSGDATITITLTASAESQDITISSSGEIR